MPCKVEFLFGSFSRWQTGGGGWQKESPSIPYVGPGEFTGVKVLGRERVNGNSRREKAKGLFLGVSPQTPVVGADRNDARFRVAGLED